MDRLLNLQIIYEAIRREQTEAELFPSVHMPGLKGFRFYDAGCTKEDTEAGFLTICVKGRGDPILEEGELLLAGDFTKEELGGREGCIHVPSCDLFRLVNLLEALFVYYRKLEERLQDILYKDSSLYDICSVAVEHFQQPVFVHDENFYILACPKMVEGMTTFDYNSQTESYIQDERTLASFRTSPAYQATLKTRGGQLWNSDFDENNCLYANIWIEDMYKGRLLVLERTASLGKLREVGYFGEVVQQAILNRYVYRNDMPGPMKGILVDVLEGKGIDPKILARKAELMGWNMNDHYVCGMIAFGKEEISRYLIFGICNSVQQHVSGSYPCYYNNAVYFLVDLTYGNLTIHDLRMHMSHIIRESLLYVGVSNVFYRLSDFPIHMQQAEIALRYSREKNLTSWYNEFQEIVLQYWMAEGLGKLTKESMMAAELGMLKCYDAQNGTDLYQTLKVYLMEERNSTLTAQILEIHRSTLPHRLERIEKLTGLNLDDFKVRLYLLMSFVLDGQN